MCLLFTASGHLGTAMAVQHHAVVWIPQRGRTHVNDIVMSSHHLRVPHDACTVFGRNGTTCERCGCTRAAAFASLDIFTALATTLC